MKQIYNIILFVAMLFVSCKGNNNVDPTAGLKEIQQFSDGVYTITAYNETGEWRLGYTKVYFTVKDKNGEWVDNAQLSAFPEMDMGTMKHSTPHSDITKVAGKSLYETYYAFLMYSGQGGGTWSYSLNYTVGNISGSFDNVEINVKDAFRPDGKTECKVIQSLTAIDGSSKRYVVTLVEPQHPKVGSNDMTACIHERVDANTFTPVENFTLKLCPTMPDMDHSSPNNVDLTYDAADKIYKGKVNFTMTGYWVLNLELLDNKGVSLYGNLPQASDYTKLSSLYFEVEF